MTEETFGYGMTAAQVAKHRRHKTDPHFPDADTYARNFDYESEIANALEGPFGSSENRLRRIVFFALACAAALLAVAFAAPFL